MAYIGTSPTQAVRTRFLYTATASQTTFSGADTQNLTLRYSDANFVDVYQNGVLLKGGGADYTATTTTSVVLATGATADDVIEIIVYDVFAVANLIKKDGDTVEGVINFNGKEITLDADFDTSITADTDDQIDIKIAGSDSLRIKANEIENVSGDFTLDVAGDITLDANGQQIFFAKGGTTFGQFGTESTPSNYTIESTVSDGDLIFKGNDGGSTIEIARFDVSEGGDFLLNKTSSDAGTAGHELLDYGRAVHTANATTVQVVNRLSSDGDIAIFQKDGSTVGAIASSSGDVKLDAPADIILDADGGDVRLSDGGTQFGKLHRDSGDFKISSSENDKDIIFMGADGGSDIEAMRIDMSEGGHVLIGRTSAGDTGNGHTIRGDDSAIFSRDASGETVQICRNNNNGELVKFKKNGSDVGAIASTIGIIVGTADTGLGFETSTGNTIIPQKVDSDLGGRDNAIDFGSSSFRFDDLHATNGTIQTSDQNEKQDIASATAKELNVAKKLSTLFKTFRWKDKVTEKGDKARTHTGIIAQEVQSAFSAEGLDASKYGLFISTTWTNEEGKEQTRLGVRYPELFSFIFSSIEARLTALESK